MMHLRKAAAAAVLAVAATAVLLVGCGAGQQSQTSNQVTATGGVEGRVGSILLRDVQFVFSGAVAGDSVYEAGDDAALQATIVNEISAGLGGDDTLTAVSSPIAVSGRIVGDARVPDGQTLTAGYDAPQASRTVGSATSVQVTLVGLTEPVRAGLSYPVRFTFAEAGSIVLEVPVENPDRLPPRAGDPTG